MTGVPPTPDTVDLRSGAPIHDSLLALLPLVGLWRGGGTGIIESTQATFTYGQQISFVHDGRAFLAYESRSWLLNPDGSVLRQAWRETGFWRPGAGGDDVEIVLASNTGQALMFTGTAGDQRWEVATVVAVPTPTAKVVSGERRLYALVEDDLVYATDLAPDRQPYAPHLSARLRRD